MAGINSNEPNTAPKPYRWYNLTLGSSFKDDHPSSKFCTLRYEFKPASIDKNQRGTLHKSKDNKVTVEFQNNQPGKPKVTFEGISEDYTENDAVIFFDGESFRLERLHRAVKRLRHNRVQGESISTAAASAGPPDASSPPVGKVPKHQPLNKESVHVMPAEVERIEIGDFKSSDAKPRNGKANDYPAAQENPSNPSPDLDNDDLEEQLNILNDDDDNGDVGAGANGGKFDVKEFESGVDVKEFESGIDIKEYDTGIDINIPHQTDTDDEIADVDASDDEADKSGQNAAEALRAQVNAEGEDQTSSSSSSGSESSGSGSGSGSESGSGSSSSDSESSDGNSVNSI